MLKILFSKTSLILREFLYTFWIVAPGKNITEILPSELGTENFAPEADIQNLSATA